MTLTGANTGGENASLAPCQYAAAVVDEDDGTVTFFPVTGRRVLRLEPRVDGVEYGAPAWEPVDETVEGRAKARTELDKGASCWLDTSLATTHLVCSNSPPGCLSLHTAFATEKRWRTTARMAAARGVAAEALPDSGALMGYFAHATRDQLTSQQLATRLAGSRNIPPHNPEATNPMQAYPLEGLCDTATLHSLPWKAVLAASRSGAAVEHLHPYVQSRLATCIASLSEAPQRERTAKVGAYLSVLLRFAAGAPRQFSGDWWATGPLADVAAGMQNHLTAKFTEATDTQQVKRPQALRDLLIAYILVAALLLEQCRLDFREVAAALVMEPPRLVTHLLALGCRIVRLGGQPPVAVLMHDAGPEQTLTSFLPPTTTRGKAPKRR